MFTTKVECERTSGGKSSPARSDVAVKRQTIRVHRLRIGEGVGWFLWGGMLLR